MDIPLPGGGGEVSEDYSPAATVVPFNPPLPLLRAPVPSSSSASTDPMPVLAFRDAASWRAAWEAAEASLFSQCEICSSFCRLVHALAVQSPRHGNASPPGGKVCLEVQQPTIKKENDAKNERWLLVLNQQRRHALSFQSKNVMHHSEMQGLPLKVSLKIPILMSGMLGVTKQHQDPCLLQIATTHPILRLVAQTTKEVTC
ncbi:uncharacterized protein LOC123400112 isoform X2 [Hordeum vulgare subsp. vulgare]|uniref:uncharacterized protein LOC123400112 isoform X2 n=1 Tax=Hordeum vulgare subsp. vulgare TaxID=112509 RepID=UPI001D1A329D|nr:uncharacterized protein LOC123400112 isoform X2 [Hordeum vulgare subsp. vulgare]